MKCTREDEEPQPNFSECYHTYRALYYFASLLISYILNIGINWHNEFVARTSQRQPVTLTTHAAVSWHYPNILVSYKSGIS